MHLIYEEYKPTILAKLIILPFMVYVLFERNDIMISLAISVILTFVFLITPPLTNLKISPIYQLIDEQGVHVVKFWGLKRRFIEWGEVRFKIKKRRVYLYESNGNCILILGLFKSIRNLEQILNKLNAEHPDYADLIKFKNSSN